MSTLNGAGHSSTSKATDQDGSSVPGFQPQNKMTVQPPRGEDLQRSYAAEIGGEANPKGWYGSMSTSLSSYHHPKSDMLLFLTLISNSQQSWRMYWNMWRNSLLHPLPQPL